MENIVDHRKNDDTMKINADAFHDYGDQQTRKNTAKGWDLCVRWRDTPLVGSWEPLLADLKEVNPVELAEYTISHCINKSSTLAWSALYTLKKSSHIIVAVNKRYPKLRIPKMVQEAFNVDN
jgi:hypothetical protein